MVTVHLEKFHKFLEDYDNRIIKEYGVLQKLSYETNLRHLKEWYDFEVEVDEYGEYATVQMTEQNYTLFMIKYS